MMLEAASLELGTAWISYFDAKRARKLLHLPESWESVCMLYVGYPPEDFHPDPTRTGRRRPLPDTCFLHEGPGGPSSAPYSNPNAKGC